jgi:glucan phosphorylase
MKFCLNDTLTIGTLDGSHIEICKNRRVELFPFDLNAAEL